jgi:hypothetical protein
VLQPSLLITGASLQRHIYSVNVPRRMYRWRPAFPLQHWRIIIKLVIKFTNCFEWTCPSRSKMDRNSLCDHNTSCFSKEQHCFYALFYRQSSFLSHLV